MTPGIRALIRARIRAALLQAGDKVGIYHVIKRMPDNLHCFLIRHAQAADELRLVARFLYRPRNRLAAAMDDDDLDADGAHEGNVVHEGIEILLDLHDATAELYQHDGPIEVLNVWQGLDENRCLGRRCIHFSHLGAYYIKKTPRFVGKTAL